MSVYEDLEPNLKADASCQFGKSYTVEPDTVPTPDTERVEQVVEKEPAAYPPLYLN